MELLDIVRKLIEHSTLNEADKQELNGHIDALAAPAAADVAGGTPAEGA